MCETDQLAVGAVFRWSSFKKDCPKVSFRITTHANGNATAIQVEGRLTTRGVPELLREFRLAGGPVRLDLSGLISADADGVRELLALEAKDVELFGASAYIRELLDRASQ